MLDDIPFTSDLKTSISIPDRAKFYLKNLADNLNKGIIMDLRNNVSSIVNFLNK